MYVCIYYMYTYSTYMYVCIYTYIHIHIYAYTHICMYLQYIHIYTYIHMYVFTIYTYIHIYTYTYIHTVYIYIYVYCISFIHSSVSGHLGCFHILAIVNSAATNRGVELRVLSGYMPRSGIAGSYGNSVFSFFEELPYCFPLWLHQFTFPPPTGGGSLFSTLSPAFIIYRCLNDGHSDWCELVPHCSLHLHLSNN